MPLKEKIQLLSPDGFDLYYNKYYSTLIEAQKDALKWIKRYKKQGYYSSVKYGRIPVEDLKNYILKVTVFI